MRVVRAPDELADAVAGARARGRVGVRRRDGVLRAATGERPPHRGADPRRRARHGLGARRARVLDPAPPPEDHRGGAVAGGRSTSCRAALCDAAAQRGPRDRLRGRGHGRVPARRRRAVLLPGDEHPPPGRAPGHRVRVRGRPRRACRSRSPRGRGCPDAAPEPRGHAIEARLYAEDPARDWRPGSGTLHTFEVPDVDAEFAVPASYGLRLDSGVESGGEIGVHYDPMLAKVIAWAPTRRAAARRLAAALRGARAPRPRHQPRAARAGAGGTRLPGRRHRHRLPGPGRPRRPRRAARRRGRGPPVRPGRRAGRGRRGPGGGEDPRRAPAGLAQRPVPAAAQDVRGPRRPDRRRLLPAPRRSWCRSCAPAPRW